MGLFLFPVACVLLVGAGFFGLDQGVVMLMDRARRPHTLREYFFCTISLGLVAACLLTVLPVVSLLVLHRYAAVVPLMVAPALALGVSAAGKYTFRRRRPHGVYTYLGPVDSSFPSGHAAGSFAAATMLAAALPAVAVLGYVLALCISISRLYLGKHFLSDVSSGALVGYVSACFVQQSSFLAFIHLT